MSAETGSFNPNVTMVTGGAGFIGSHVVERLLGLGFDVVVVDNFDPFYSVEQKRANLRAVRAAGDFQFYETDIRDQKALEKVFRAHSIEAVIHLAARPSPRASVGNAHKYVDINLRGSLNVFELAAQARVGNLVFAGSSSVYTEMDTPFKEDAPADRPYSPYGATKRACEMMGFTYSHLYGLPMTTLRFFTAYGPRLRPDLMIYKFTRLIDAKQPVPIYGDGASRRDYTYIADIVDGLIAALRAPRPFETFNLGGSRTTPLMDVVKALERALGKKAQCEFMSENPSDAPITYADITRARRWLGFEPSVSLEDGIARFVDWYRAQKHV